MVSPDFLIALFEFFSIDPLLIFAFEIIILDDYPTVPRASSISFCEACSAITDGW